MRKYKEQPFLLLKVKADLVSEKRQNFCNCATENNEDQPTDDHIQDFNNTNDINNLEASLELSLEEADFSLRRLKRLKVLKMGSCLNITDTGLSNGINLFQLQELDLKLCTKISGRFLDIINPDDRIFNNLKTLNLNQCIGIQEEYLLKLINCSPNIRELNVSAVPAVTDHLVDTLLKKKRLLSLLDVSFCSNLKEIDIDRYEQFLYNEFGSQEFILDKRFISR